MGIVEQMFADVQRGTIRQADSPCNSVAMRETTHKTYIVDDVSYNVFRFRELNERWLEACTVHFFAETEEAADFFSINPHAARFLTGTRFVGAYGPIYMPQLRLCVEELKRDSWTRRAIATSGITQERDQNAPACINLMHFLRQGETLSMHCYQRSCNLYGVLPYDAVLVTNILNWVAASAGIPMGRLYWTFGSLHCTDEDLKHQRSDVIGSLLFTHWLLSEPHQCRAYLKEL